MDCIGVDWCGLNWSEWVGLDGPVRLLRSLPNSAGVYRVKIRAEDELAYIGETGGSIRKRLRSLRRGLIAEEMPHCDPHTAAPSLWAYRQEEGYGFEVSGASLGCDVSRQNRKGFESYLLWTYRHQVGRSPVCSFGRTHHKYLRSRRKETGVIGVRLAEGENNPSIGPSLPPLRKTGAPLDRTWMGLSWSNLSPLDQSSSIPLSSRSGVYRIVDFDIGNLIYIGESKGGMTRRIRKHSRKGWNGNLRFSYAKASDILKEAGQSLSDMNYLEAETDLIGYFYELTGRAPKYQFNPLGALSDSH